MNDLTGGLGIPREEIVAKLKAELVDLLELDSPETAHTIDSINEDTRLVEDLDIDSLGMVDLVMTIEDCFDITLDTNIDLSEFKTIGDVVNALDRPPPTEQNPSAARSA